VQKTRRHLPQYSISKLVAPNKRSIIVAGHDLTARKAPSTFISGSILKTSCRSDPQLVRIGVVDDASTNETRDD
jgi:hypothetical protein